MNHFFRYKVLKQSRNSSNRTMHVVTSHSLILHVYHYHLKLKKIIFDASNNINYANTESRSGEHEKHCIESVQITIN